MVVDVGMHTKGMTGEESIQYMIDSEAISKKVLLLRLSIIWPLLLRDFL